MTIRTQLRAGRITNVRANAACVGASSTNHNETLKVRSALKAGGLTSTNHNEALKVRTALKAGGINTTNHNEALRRESDRQAISMKKQVRATGPKQERLELLVVRAGLRAGRARAERRYS